MAATLTTLCKHPPSKTCVWCIFDSTPNEGSMPASNAHVMYKTGDPGVPESITDGHGGVALAMCKYCGLAESQLDDKPTCDAAGVHEVTVGELLESREGDYFIALMQPPHEQLDPKLSKYTMSTFVKVWLYCLPEQYVMAADKMAELEQVKRGREYVRAFGIIHPDTLLRLVQDERGLQIPQRLRRRKMRLGDD